MIKNKWIAPSLLSADFSNLQKEIAQVEKAGADLLHLDIMDGHFVPNLTIGPVVIKAIRSCTNLMLDCHLMIEEPEKYIEPFAKAGADMISVHCEAKQTKLTTLRKIKQFGIKAGIALNPDSPVHKYISFFKEADYVLVMSVYPGFSEQTFIESTIKKLKEVHALRQLRHFPFKIEVDGGVKINNIRRIAEAGADIFVAGSAIFKSTNYKDTMLIMRGHIDGTGK